jgi:hypothetical protein
VSCKTVYRWVATKCCFTSDVIDFEIATSVAAVPVEFVLSKTLSKLLLVEGRVVSLHVVKEYGEVEYISSHS